MLVLSGLVALACRTAPRAPVNAVEIVPAAAPPAPAVRAGDRDLVVSLAHTGCFGGCATFSVQLYASGLVCWDDKPCGEDPRDVRVPATAVARVIDAFIAARVLDRDRAGELPGPHPVRDLCHDGAGAILTFRHDGRAITFDDQHCAMPAELDRLAALVDEVTNQGMHDAGPDGLR
jgi:hypothetical protein